MSIVENSSENNKPINNKEKYKEIFKIYFRDAIIDMDCLLKQDEQQLIIFIKDIIVPEISKEPPQLRKLLEKYKLIKKQKWKDSIAELTKTKKTDAQIRLEYKERLKKLNPKIIGTKIEQI